MEQRRKSEVLFIIHQEEGFVKPQSRPQPPPMRTVRNPQLAIDDVPSQHVQSQSGR
jgi:hypothetical protein